MRCAGTSSGSGTDDRAEPHGRSSKEVPVSIVGGLDVHRREITFDWVDRATGQAQRGQITPATREGLGRWLAQLPDHHGAFAVEARTGWRFVVEELQAVGWQAYLAEPAETAALRGPKRRAKTDRTDAQLLGELLEQGRLPQAWIPPAHLPGAVGAGAAAQDPGRSAHRLAAAAARGVVPPRPALPRPCPADPGHPQLAGTAGVASGQPPAGHDRAAPDRPARPGAGSVGALAARHHPAASLAAGR